VFSQKAYERKKQKCEQPVYYGSFNLFSPYNSRQEAKHTRETVYVGSKTVIVPATVLVYWLILINAF